MLRRGNTERRGFRVIRRHQHAAVVRVARHRCHEVASHLNETSDLHDLTSGTKGNPS